MLKKEEKQASEECFRPQQDCPASARCAVAGNIVRTRVLVSRMTTTLQEKAFFSEIHIVENKHAKLKLFSIFAVTIRKSRLYGS